MEVLKRKPVPGGRPERKKQKISSLTCPVCTLTIRGEKGFREHYQQEMEFMKPENLHLLVGKPKTKSSRVDESSENDVVEKNEPSYEERVKALRAIKKQKYARYSKMFLTSMSVEKNVETHRSTPMHNTRSTISRSNTASTNNTIATNNTATTSSSATYETVCCAVCNEFIDCTDDQLAQKHLSKCFAKREYEFDIYSDEDSDDDVSVEEFSWAGQTWTRATSLVDRESLRGTGKLMILQMEDGDEELDIDTPDDTYGQTQYSESDIIHSKEPTKDSSPCHHDNGSTKQEFVDIESLERQANGDEKKLCKLLKEAVEGLDSQLTDALKCSICMGPYRSPLVATGCWHVCCSECWMRTLAAKKMCPKCNNIVAPSQLRKLYM